MFIYSLRDSTPLILKRYFDGRTTGLQPTRMQKQQTIWNSEPAVEIEIHQSRPTTLNSDITEAPACHRRIRVALPKLPRRQSCITRRAMLAALREAELAEWQASGGDTLRSLASH